MFRFEQMRSFEFFFPRCAVKMHSKIEIQNEWKKNCDDATAFLNCIYVSNKSLPLVDSTTSTIGWPRELPTVRGIGAKVSPFHLDCSYIFTRKLYLRTIIVYALPLRISATSNRF